jgi:hypothetical protein
MEEKKSIFKHNDGPRAQTFIFDRLAGSVNDVFYNSFDKTWAEMKFYYIDGVMPKTWTKLPIEIAEDDGTVTYELNDDYFRCDNFTRDHKNPHILFAGCSQTEGIGAPLETVWSKIVLESVSPESGFYTIAKSGFGWQKVISNFMVYVEKYGAPEYLFVLLPNLGRFFQWDHVNKRYIYVQRYPNGGVVSKEQEDEDKVPNFLFIEKPLTLDEHRKSFVDFAIGWRLFEKYCASIGTKMLWASWDYTENENYRLANISKNYIDLSAENLMSFIREKRPDGKMGKFDLNRRDGHSGILINEYWADAFNKEIKDRGWL